MIMDKPRQILDYLEEMANFPEMKALIDGRGAEYIPMDIQLCKLASMVSSRQMGITDMVTFAITCTLVANLAMNLVEEFKKENGD
jgi:hypothetical protein